MITSVTEALNVGDIIAIFNNAYYSLKKKPHKD